MGKLVISSMPFSYTVKPDHFCLDSLAVKDYFPLKHFSVFFGTLSCLNSCSCPGISCQKTLVHITASCGILKMSIYLWPSLSFDEIKAFSTVLKMYLSMLLLWLAPAELQKTI